MTFGQESIVLHITPSVINKFSVHAWSKCGGLNEEHSVCQEVLIKMRSMNRNSLLFVQIQTLTQSIHHHKQKKITDIACKTTNGISFGPTSDDEKSHMVKDNPIAKRKSIVNHKD